MLRAEKEQITERVLKDLSESKILLCVDYRGLTVAQVTQLRIALRKVNATVKVIKNTLLKRAFEGAFVNASKTEKDKFEAISNGPTMVIYSDKDPIEPTKKLCEFVEKIECLTVKGGFFDGEFLSEARVTELSKMKGREQILGDLLRVLLAPATQVVRLINEPASLVVRVLAAQRDAIEKA